MDAAPGSLARHLAEVEAALHDALAGEDRLLAAARHLALAPGAKRARPRLAWQLAQVAGAPAAATRDVAVAVELIHSASLLHDDIVDDAALRRGQPTAHLAHGPAAAVLSGDLALSLALAHLAPLGTPCVLHAARVVAEMSRAAILEVDHRGDAHLPLAAWHRLAAGKTGALFGLAGRLVALAAGEPARGERFDRACRHLGVAFQLGDDLDDLAPAGGREPALTDLTDGTPSFPVLAAAAAEPALATALTVAWRRRDPAAARALAPRVLAAGGDRRARVALEAELTAARVAFAGDLAHPRVIELLVWADALVPAAARATMPAAMTHPEGRA